MENITVTFSNLTADQAANLFAALRHDYSGPAPVVEPATAQDAPAKPVKAAAPKPSRRKAKPVEAPQAPVQEVLAKPQADPVTTASIDDVRNALSDLLAAKGMTECAQLLAEFGAARIGELPQDKYAAVVAACKERQA